MGAGNSGWNEPCGLWQTAPVGRLTGTKRTFTDIARSLLRSAARDPQSFLWSPEEARQDSALSRNSRRAIQMIWTRNPD
jgi:hypothetical protein